MAYVPDPDDATQPTDDKPAGSGAEEFRKLKAKLLAATLIIGDLEAAVNAAQASADSSAFSAIQAADTLDIFTDLYLGSKAADPVVDNDGNTLQQGALYFRTSMPSLMRVYNGGNWQDVGSITSTTTNTIDPSLYASQIEAEQGTNNVKVMTPLRTSDAITYQILQRKLERIPPGTIWPMARLTTPAGWLPVDGKTIGNAASGATSRANADCFECFEQLWAFPAISVPIYTSTGAASTRGANALADWNANKRIAVFTANGGFFLRSWTSTQTSDAGRVVGSFQANEIKQTTGLAESVITDLVGNSSGGLSLSSAGARFAVTPNGGGGQAYKTLNLSIGTGNDTHPDSLAIPHYIKL